MDEGALIPQEEEGDEDDEDTPQPNLSEDTVSKEVKGVLELMERITSNRVGKSSEVDTELLQHLREFFVARRKSGEGAARVNFATVAHFLHATYGGDFCSRFGYRRPKDLALALEAGEYAKLSHYTTTLYMEPTDKLFERDGESPEPR